VEFDNFTHEIWSVAAVSFEETINRLTLHVSLSFNMGMTAE
jgi:hypothetical protein